MCPPFQTTLLGDPPQVLPKGAEVFCKVGSDLLQSELDHVSTAGLAVLGTFHVCVQMVLQGGAKIIQPAQRQSQIGISNSRNSLKQQYSRLAAVFCHESIVHIYHHDNKVIVPSPDGGLQLLQLRPT